MLATGTLTGCVTPPSESTWTDAGADDGGAPTEARPRALEEIVERPGSWAERSADDAAEPLDAPSEPYRPLSRSAPDAESLEMLEVELEGVATHRVHAETPWGDHVFHVVETADGSLVADGDMVLGHVSQLRGEGEEKVLFHSDTTLRWPGARIRYEIPSNVSALANVIEGAMDRLSQRTPLRFERCAGDSCGRGNFVRFVPYPGRPNAGQSPVGMQSGGPNEIKLGTNVGTTTVMHEIMHTAGVFHEHNRPFRHLSVTYFPECVRSDAGNFALETRPYFGVPIYDMDSLMHYSSDAWCVQDAADLDRDGNTTECGFRAGTSPLRPCWTLERVAGTCARCSDRDGDGDDEFIGGVDNVSIEDVNGLYLLYAQPVGANERTDQFGEVVAVGDFDGDDYDDLAVGAPFEAPGGDPASGAVFVFRGTYYGLVPWRVLTQETRPVQDDGALGSALGVNEEADSFGASLAVFDFDADGIDDLAVGAPNEAPGNAPAAGAVYVFRGHRNRATDARHGLQPFAALNQASLGLGANEAGDRFGTSLAAGDLDRDGHNDDLAIGAPGEAPGDNPRSGAVFLVSGKAWFWQPDDFIPIGSVTQVDLAPYADFDSFGQSVAFGDLDGDGTDDLAVGAPGRDAGGVANVGAVFVFHGATRQLDPWRMLAKPGTAIANSRYGSAMATGDVSGDGRADLVVVAAVDVDLDHPPAFTRAQDPRDRPGRPDLDRPQVADEQVRSGDGVTERGGPSGELSGGHVGDRRDQSAL